MRIDRGTSTKRNTMLSIMSIKVVLLVLLTLAFFESNPDCTFYVQHYHIHIHILYILSCIYMCIARHTETLTLWAFLSANIKYPLNMVTRIQGRHCTRITLNLQIFCWYQITPRKSLISYQKKQLKYIFGVSHITQFDNWTTQTVEVPSRDTFNYPLKTNLSHHWSTQCMFCPQSWWPHGQWRAAWQNSPPSQSSSQCTNAWSGRACRYRCTSELE